MPRVAKVQRVVCGGCFDFKISIALAAVAFPDWGAKKFEPEDKVPKAPSEIEGVSMIEMQAYTPRSVCGQRLSPRAARLKVVLVSDWRGGSVMAREGYCRFRAARVAPRVADAHEEKNRPDFDRARADSAGRRRHRLELGGTQPTLGRTQPPHFDEPRPPELFPTAVALRPHRPIMIVQLCRSRARCFQNNILGIEPNRAHDVVAVSHTMAPPPGAARTRMRDEAGVGTRGRSSEVEVTHVMHKVG